MRVRVRVCVCLHLLRLDPSSYPVRHRSISSANGARLFDLCGPGFIGGRRPGLLPQTPREHIRHGGRPTAGGRL